MTNKLRYASFFAGVGGIDLGFEQTNKVIGVYANEFDPSPRETYNLNFELSVDSRDINAVPSNDIPDFDIMLSGFPCQAFSIAGKQQGFEDDLGRGTLFFKMIRILNDKKPRYAFFENVKNLISHDHGNTFKVICQLLDSIGYTYKYKVLNACEYGNIPQGRERIYIIAFRDKKDYDSFSWIQPIKLTKSVKNIIDFDLKEEDRYYYTYDNAKPEIVDALEDAMKDDNPDSPSVYQWRRKYVRKNQSFVIPTLTANMGTGGHNVPIIKTKYGIRKMTPRECFRAQGFPDSFKLPTNLANGKLYKQAGNSVCVPVIHRLAEELLK